MFVDQQRRHVSRVQKRPSRLRVDHSMHLRLTASRARQLEKELVTNPTTKIKANFRNSSFETAAGVALGSCSDSSYEVFGSSSAGIAKDTPSVRTNRRSTNDRVKNRIGWRCTS